MEDIKMKKLISILLAISICVSCVAVMTLGASAATCSSGTSTQTITVNTKSAYYYPGSSSITLSQTKGVVSYDKTTRWGRVVGTGTAKYYGTWNITVRATDGSDSFKKSLTGSSLKIKLKPNKTYKITVTYNGAVDTIIMVAHENSRWTRRPSWKVSSTWKVSSYN